MVYHKVPNNFYALKPPVRVYHDWKGKCWRLLDTNDKIIADNLTKELAETLMQAVNFCKPAINFTKLFVKLEHVVTDREEAAPEDITYRNAMYNQAVAFMVDLGIIELPPKYVDALPIWKAQLMENFYEEVISFTGTITL